MTEPWQWPRSTWQGHVDHVRAGRSLTPPQWPGGARAAVALSFDSDHETIPLRDARDQSRQALPGASTAPASPSRRSCGCSPSTGCRRPSSCRPSPPCCTRRRCEAYVAGGHEVAVHGWIHERNTQLDHADELRPDRTGDGHPRAALGLAPGRHPHAELGLLRPHPGRHPRAGPGLRLLADGRRRALPAAGRRGGDRASWRSRWSGSATTRRTSPWTASPALRPYTPPRAVLQIWLDEFEAARAEGGLFQLTMHPHVIGHRSRLVVLRALLEHIRVRGPLVRHPRRDRRARAARPGGLLGGLPVRVRPGPDRSGSVRPTRA